MAHLNTRWPPGTGWWAPKGTPPDVVAAMQAELKKALNGDELKGIWTSLGTETPTSGAPTSAASSTVN